MILEEFVTAVPPGATPLNHWYVRLSPIATTVKSAGNPAQTLVLAGCVVITTTFLIVTVVDADAGPHGPGGSSVVYVRVTDPEVISEADGV